MDLLLCTDSRKRHEIRGEPAARPGTRLDPAEIETTVVALATKNPGYGCKRIAGRWRRAGTRVPNRPDRRVKKIRGRLRKPVRPKAELYRAAKIESNERRRMDGTHAHLPGLCWGYAITAIDAANSRTRSKEDRLPQ